jgi:hypothetical protein
MSRFAETIKRNTEFDRESEKIFLSEYCQYEDIKKNQILIALCSYNETFVINAIAIERNYFEANNFLARMAALMAFSYEKFQGEGFFLGAPICHSILSNHRALIHRVSTYAPIKTGPIYFTASFVKCVQCVIRDEKEGIAPHLETMRKLSKRGWEKRYADLVQVFEGYLAGDKDLVMASLKVFQKKVSKEPERKLWSEVFVVEVAALAKLFLSKGMSLDTESLGLPKELMEDKPLEKALGYPFMEEWMQEAGL